MDGNTGYDHQPQTDEQATDCQMNVGRNVLEELKAERNALDPSFLHCVRLLDKGIIWGQTHVVVIKISLPF